MECPSIDGRICNDRGVCDEDSNECICDIFYITEEKDCGQHWKDRYPAWEPIFITYASIFAVILLILLFADIYQLYIRWKVRRKKFWKLDSWILTLIGTGLIIRIIHLLIDPHGYRELIPLAASRVIFLIPFLCWIICYFLFLLFWIRITNFKSIIKKEYLRSLVYVSIAAFLVFVVGSSIAVSVGDTTTVYIIAWTFHHVSLSLIFLVWVVLSIYYGRKVIHVLEDMKDIPVSMEYSKRVTKFLWAINATNITAVLVLLILALSFLIPHIAYWMMPLCHMIAHILVTMAISFMLLLLQRTKLDEEGTEINTEAKTSSPSINSST